MSPLPGSTRAWPVLILAGAALAGGCDHSVAPLLPTGGGGTLAAEISASANSGRAPLEITFTSDVHGGDGAYRYEWSFGDGRTSTAANPRVQFLSGGSFDVRLQSRRATRRRPPVPSTCAWTPMSGSPARPTRRKPSLRPPSPSAPIPAAGRARSPTGGISATARPPPTAHRSTPMPLRRVPRGPHRHQRRGERGLQQNCHPLRRVPAAELQGDTRRRPRRPVPRHSQLLPLRRLRLPVDFGGSGGGFGVHTARPLFTYDASGTYVATLNASTDGGSQGAACQVKVTVP